MANNYFGERLRSLRTDLGLSQRDFANSLKVSPGYLSEVESGIKKPGFDLIEALKNIYGIDLNDWFYSNEASKLLMWAAVSKISVKELALKLDMPLKELIPFLYEGKRLSNKILNGLHKIGVDVMLLFSDDKEEKLNAALRKITELEKENKELKDRMSEILKAAKGL